MAAASSLPGSVVAPVLVVPPIAILAAARDLLVAYPIVGFVALGILGGIAGWAFAVEQGLLDESTARDHACFATRRAILGGCLGVAVWMMWDVWGSTSVMLGMLAAGVAGAFPMHAFAIGATTVRRFVNGRMGDQR